MMEDMALLVISHITNPTSFTLENYTTVFPLILHEFKAEAGEFWAIFRASRHKRLVIFTDIFRCVGSGILAQVATQLFVHTGSYGVACKLLAKPPNQVPLP